MPVSLTAQASFTMKAVGLKKALAAVKPAVGRRGYLPVLNGVRITVTDVGTTVTATDLETTITAPLQTGPYAVGTMVLPFTALADAVRKVPAKSDAVVTVTLSDGSATATVGPLTVSIPALPADEWPRDDDSTPVGEIAVDMDRLAEVASAASADQARPILASVAFIGEDIVATDSYRLHAVRGTGQSVTGSVLVPISACKVAVKHGGHATFTYGPRVATFSFDDLTITTRIIEGEFPRWESLVPVKSHTVTFDRSELAATVASFSCQKNDSTPVKLECGHRSATLSYNVTDVAACSATIGCRTEAALLPAGSAMAGSFLVAFNPAYLLSALAVGTDQVALGMVDAMKPMVVRENLSDGATRIRLLMPVRV